MKSTNLRPAFSLLQQDFPEIQLDKLRDFCEGKAPPPEPPAPFVPTPSPDGKFHSRDLPTDGAVLLRVREAARRLSCSDRVVWELLEQGKLKRVKLLGKKATRIAVSDLNAFAGTR